MFQSHLQFLWRISYVCFRNLGIFIGNTFAYTVFCSYASFWLAFGTMNVPAFGMLSAYENSVELGNAIGFS